MPWARYDDEFSMNRKVGRLIGRGKDGVAAIGLHLLANTYCRHNGTGGHVESHVPNLLVGSFGRKLAKILQDEGLFDPDERGGWMIHDYAEFHDPNDPEPDRSAADRKKELSEKRSEAGRRGGLARAAKQTPSKPTDLLQANAIANGQQCSSPDPVPVPTTERSRDSLPPRHGVGGGGDNRIEQIVAAYAVQALRTAAERGTRIGDAEAYQRKAALTGRSHDDLHRYAAEYPDAPPDAVAAWLHGDKHSMPYYANGESA